MSAIIFYLSERLVYYCYDKLVFKLYIYNLNKNDTTKYSNKTW